MKHLNTFSEFLNEGKITKISDEELVDAYKRSYEGDKNKLDVFAKELKKRGMTEYLKESVNEATSISTWTDKEVQDVWRQLHTKSGNAYKRFKQEMEKRGLPLDESNINEAQKYDIEDFLGEGNIQDKADAINAFGRVAKRKDLAELATLYYNEVEFNDGEYLDSFKTILKKYKLIDKFNAYYQDYIDETDPAGGHGLVSHESVVTEAKAIKLGRGDQEITITDDDGYVTLQQKTGGKWLRIHIDYVGSDKKQLQDVIRELTKIQDKQFQS